MTIFDYFKYDIDNLSFSELRNNLPNDLFSYWYRHYWNTSMSMTECFVVLKELLMTYDTEECKVKKYYDDFRQY